MKRKTKTTATPEVQPEVEAPKRPRGRWRRRFKFGLVLAATGLVGARIALPFALPSLLERTLAKQGLEGRYGQLDLSLLGGRLELWHLELAPLRDSEEEPPSAPAPDALAWLEYVVLDLDVSALFTGRFVAHRVEVDGLDLWLDRDEAGHWNTELVAAARPTDDEPEPEESAEPAPEAAEQKERKPVNLSLPVRLDALRLQEVQLNLDDRFLSPALFTHLHFDLSVSDLGSKKRPARLAIDLGAPERLDRLRVEGTLKGDATHADLDLHLRLDGLRLGAFTPYLQPLGLEPTAERLDGRFRAAVKLAVPENDERELTADVALGPFALTADGITALGFESAAVVAPALLGDTLRVTSVTLEGLELRADRDARHRTVVAGLALVPGAPAAPQKQEPETVPADESAPAEPRPIHVDRIALLNGAVHYRDASFVDTQAYDIALERLELERLRLGDPGPSVPAQLTLRLTAPELFESLTLGGDVWSGPLGSGAALQLELAGLAPVRAQPLLADMGLTANLESGTLQAALRAQLTPGPDSTIVEAALEQLRFTDGERQLLALDRAELADGELREGNTRLGALTLETLELPLALDEAGNFELLGFRTLQPAEPRPERTPVPAAAPAAEVDPAQTAPTAPVAAPARLAIDRIDVSGVRAPFVDRSRATPHAIEVGPLSIGGERLVILPGEHAGALDVELSIAGLLEPLAARLVLSDDAGALTLAGTLDARRLAYDAVAPYLTDAGWTSELEAGRLVGDFDVRLGDAERGLDARLETLSIQDGPRSLFELNGVQLAQLRSGADGGTQIESVSLAGLSAAARRDAQGRLHAFGLVSSPVPVKEVATVEPAPTPLAGAPVPLPESQNPPAPAAEPASLSLALLDVQDVAFEWTDEFLKDPLTLEPRLGVRLKGFTTDVDATAPASLELNLDLGPAGTIGLGGALAVRGSELDLDLELIGEGLTLEPVAGYLPPGVSSELQQGRLGARLALETGSAEDGGTRVKAALEQLVLESANRTEPLLGVERLALDIPRLDPASGQIVVNEVALEGVELTVDALADGELRLLGLRIAAPPAEPPADSEAVAVDADEQAPELAPDPTSEPVADAVADAEPAPATAPATPLERLDVERLVVDLSRIRIVDPESPDAVPLDLALRLENPTPLQLVAPLDKAAPPLELTLRGSMGELIRELSLDITANRADRSSLDVKVQLALTGLHGKALTDALPYLTETLDASGLEDGRLTASLEVLLEGRREGPILPRLDNGFGVELNVGEVGLFSTPTSHRAVGFDAFIVDAPRLDPRRGQLIADRVELLRPSFHTALTERGLEFAGLTLLTPQEEAVSDEEAAEAPPEEPTEAAPEVAVAVAVAVAEPTEEPAPEATGAQLAAGAQLLSIIGADIGFRDETVDPVLDLPITTLEFEGRELTTRALSEPLPVAFELFVGAGDVTLPERKVAKSILTGVLGAMGSAAASALTGESAAVEFEQRPAFDELSASARVTLFPKPIGWTRVRLSAFELQVLRGLAAGGVDIGDGLLDLDVRTRLAGAEPARIDTKTNLAFLRLSEPPGGPISRYLKLPAPLDAVIFALKGRGGELKIPLGVDVSLDGGGVGGIANAAVSALGAIVVSAVANAPLRAVGSVGSLIGLGGGEEQAVEPIVIELPFAPGGTLLLNEAEAGVNLAVSEMQRNPDLRALVVHEFGAEDYARAALLANPSAQATSDLIASQRARRESLIERRGDAALEAGTALALGRTDACDALCGEIKAIDAQLASCEASIDALGPLLAPSAARRADRRQRDAALAIASLRLGAVSAGLAAGAVDDLEGRLDLRSARATEPELDAGGRVVIVLRPAN